MLIIKQKASRYCLQFLFIVCCGLLMSFVSHAEPYLAVKNNLKCAACHVNSNGGGLRNDFGNIYGQSLLPAQANSFDSAKLAKLTQYLTIGADARFNANFQRTEQSTTSSEQAELSKSFEISSAQLYLNINIPNSGLSFYLDQQVAPGSAINREALVIYDFDNGDSVKAGKLFLPFGLRIEDDSAFIGQATGMNFDNSDNGIEYDLNTANSTINFFIANGTSQATNNDDRFLYGLRAEHLLTSFRLGAGLIINDGEQNVQMFNVYGGSQWRNFTLLAELDYLILDNANSFTEQDIKQLVSLLEVNYQWAQGWNFKFTAEYFDSDIDVDENEQTRYSFIGEYTPISNVQLRFGVRMKQDIPQKPQQNYDTLFLQSHFYF